MKKLITSILIFFSVAAYSQVCDDVIKAQDVRPGPDSMNVSLPSISDTAFVFIKSFRVVVPQSYKPKGCSNFMSDYQNQIFYSLVTSEEAVNFDTLQPSQSFISGATYQVSLYLSPKQASGYDCLAFLKKKNSVFMGLEGITFLVDNYFSELPQRGWGFSFDMTENLPADPNGHYGVPALCRSPFDEHLFTFGFTSFNEGVRGAIGDYLICFTKM